MSLQRLQIRHAIRDRLRGATSAGDRVFTSRVRAYDEKKLPALAVYTAEEPEPTVRSDSEPRQWARLLTVAVDLVVKHTAAKGLPDDTIDRLAAEVEQLVLGGPRTLGLDFVEDVRPAGVQIEFDGRGERLMGAARVLFEVPYVWELDEDPLDTGHLKVMVTDWDLAAPDGELEAVDQQGLPE